MKKSRKKILKQQKFKQIMSFSPLITFNRKYYVLRNFFSCLFKKKSVSTSFILIFCLPSVCSSLRTSIQQKVENNHYTPQTVM